MKNKEYKKIMALSALKRRNSAPKIVVIAPTGSGKSTLVFLLMNGKLLPYMRIGIGDKSLTTIIASEICLDERIENDNKFAVRIIRKGFKYHSIHYQIIKLLLELFGSHDYDVEETIEALDDSVINRILEPVEGKYHLDEIKDQLDFEKLKEALTQLLEALNDADYESRYREKKAQLKGKKPKVAELRELVFDEIFESLDQKKTSYIDWLNNIGTIIEIRLLNAAGEKIFKGEMVEYDIEEDDGKAILQELFNPFSPYSLIVDCINVACRPRQELIDIAKKNYPNLPFRFCIRDTMGMNQGMAVLDLNDIKDSLEVALNCKADAVLYLMSLEEDDITLEACSKALAEKQEALRKNGKLNVRFNILYTKADRIIENLISNSRTDGTLVINAETYEENIEGALSALEGMISKYSAGLSSDSAGYVSMRFVEDSLIEKALKYDNRRKNFEPEGIFDKISDMAMTTLISTLPKDVVNPIFVSAKDADKSAVSMNVSTDQIRKNIQQMKELLCNTKDIVNGYIIPNSTPRIHGRSVNNYWNRLALGLGYSTKAHVYGNFSINMKGLMKRVIYAAFPSFASFDSRQAIDLTADNLDDDVLETAMKEIFGTDNLEAGMNPALGTRNIYLQRLYEYFRLYFNDPERYASVVDRVSYNLTYGNPDVKAILNKAYYGTEGYDLAMRKLQYTFRSFFGSEKFSEILKTEFESVMNEMINKLFITI